MRSAASASRPSEEGPPLSFSSCLEETRGRLVGPQKRTNHRYHHQQTQQQMIDEEYPGPRRNDLANLERVESVSSSGQP
ncbi:hypothetical protein PC123_g27156 [Phytophthora cactorum]|nr:hypothetical protein PC123_g27156 [Phytophthora cactorum]